MVGLIGLSLVLFIPYIALIICQPLYHRFGCGKRIYHNLLGWHLPIENKQEWKGTLCSKCKYCSRDIYQDSRGIWTSY